MITMNYRWTTVIVWSCMNNLSIILIMSPLRCLAVRYMLRGIHRYESWWSGHTWNGLYSTAVCCMVCCCFAQTALSCSQRTFSPQQVEAIQNEIGKTGKKSLTQLSHPSPEWNSGTWNVQSFSAMLRPHLSSFPYLKTHDMALWFSPRTFGPFLRSPCPSMCQAVSQFQEPARQFRRQNSLCRSQQGGDEATKESMDWFCWENLQDTIRFSHEIWINMGFSCNCSLKPIHWKRPYVMLTSNFRDVSNHCSDSVPSQQGSGPEKDGFWKISLRFPALVSIGFYRWRSTSSGLSLRHWSASALKHLLILRCRAQDDLEIYKTQWPAKSGDSS